MRGDEERAVVRAKMTAYSWNLRRRGSARQVLVEKPKRVCARPEGILSAHRRCVHYCARMGVGVCRWRVRAAACALCQLFARATW